MKAAILQPKIRKLRQLAGKAADALSRARTARVQARVARVSFKKAKKQFKQAKRTAKEALKAAKLAQTTLKLATTKLGKVSLPRKAFSARPSRKPEVLVGVPVRLSLARADGLAGEAHKNSAPRKKSRARAANPPPATPPLGAQRSTGLQDSGGSEKRLGLSSI
jgi:hypothetical protein